MKVSDIMSLSVVTVGPKAPLRDLWKAIFKKHIHALPVVDTKKKLLGIVSEEDLLKPLYPNYQEYIEDFIGADDFEDMEEKIYDVAKLTAQKVMSKKVIFTREETPVMRALSRMIVRNVRQLPVLSKVDTVIGVITKGDIFDALFTRHLAMKKPVVKRKRRRK